MNIEISHFRECGTGYSAIINNKFVLFDVDKELSLHDAVKALVRVYLDETGQENTLVDDVITFD